MIKVCVKLLGEGCFVYLNFILKLDLLFNKCWNFGKLFGVEIMRIFCIFVNISIEIG